MAIASNFPAIKPSLSLDFANTKRLDSRVTFTRTTTATYYDGVTTAKAEQNLLRNSQVFSYDVSSWDNTVGNTITSSTEIAPDGTATATKFTANNGATTSFIGSFNIGVTVTNYGATINLSTGATATAFGTLNGSITATQFPAGSGWYRIVVTQDGYTFSFYAKAAEYTFVGVQVSNSFRMYACNQSGNTALSPAGDGTKGILIWGAQLEQRSSVTAYTATTTQPITNYIPVLLTAASGVARFQHNPTTDESLGLLIEEARTNLLTYSADFSNAAWVKSRASITSNTIVAPDGTLTGDKLVEDTTATNTHYIVQTYSYTSGTAYNYSFYAKAAERTRVAILAFPTNSVFTSSTAIFNLSTGLITRQDAGFTSASITNVGNGWYRCSIAITAAATATGSIGILLANGDTSVTYTGDGYSGAYIWGAQLEAGAFPTSYIATTAATVTRNADIATMTGSNFTSWYNQAQGTFVLTAATSVVGAPNFPRFFWVRGSDTTNTINAIQFRSAGQFGANVTTNNVSQGDVTVNGLTANTLLNGAVSYAANDVAVSFNGSAVATDTSVVLPVVNTLEFGNVNGAAQMVTGYIKKLAYYPLRLTNANLQALTS
jgi:hypothetical protein